MLWFKLFIYLFLWNLVVYAQDSTYYYFNSATPINTLKNKVKNVKEPSNIAYYQLILYSRIRNLDSMLYYINVLKNSNLEASKKGKFLYFEGFYYKLTDNDSLLFKKNNSALQYALQHKDTLTVLYSLTALSQSYDYKNEIPYNKEYLDILYKKATTYNNLHFKKLHKYLTANYYLFLDDAKKAKQNYKQLLQYKFTNLDSIYISYTYNNLGVLYETVLNNSDSAIYYYLKKIDFMNRDSTYAIPEKYFNTYLNIGNSYRNLNNFKKAKAYYTKADSTLTKKNELFNNVLLKENLAKLYEKSKNYKLALANLKEYNQLNDSLNKEGHNIAITNIKEKYDNEKLRADNLEIEAKRIQNRNLLIGSLFLLVVVGIIAFLANKNAKRKQHIAEQEKALQQQKLTTVLKEQELNSINAMIAGQEKERQRIANDLHDDLGGLMATIKLQFNSLKQHKSEELFTKTDTLLNEAYTKIRSIAHAKNAGLIAKDGLLKAVQEMAEKVSKASTVSIMVHDHGLENRLENTLELTFFRIIQELITNALKHAKATEITIHLTNHKNTLNIMVEDNGIGFNTKKIDTKGMGIRSIEKRIEHLEGSLTLESEINKGTSIIIDIPLEEKETTS